MAKRKHERLSERSLKREFWRQAFLAAEFPALMRRGLRINPAGLAHLAAEYADAAVAELSKRLP